jgi:hypothetical protein
MKREGLELLKKRTETSKDLVKLINITEIPQKFALFLNHYKVGDGSYISKYLKYKNDDYVLNRLIMFDNEILEGEEYYAVIDYIYEYEKLIEEYGKYKNKVENWNKEGFMQIGIMYWGDVLLLGVEEDKKDEIWRYGNGLVNTVLSKLDNNIFDFFSRLKSAVDTETLEELNINTSQLYRNWGEDFWRVREEGKDV